MPTPTPTAEIDTGAELARRLAIKREITATLADGAQSTSALAEQVDGVSTALVRQLADELAADGEIRRETNGGRVGNRYALPATREVAADD